MTAWWVAAACLVGAAALLALPSRHLRARQRAVFGRSGRAGQGHAVPGHGGPGRAAPGHAGPGGSEHGAPDRENSPGRRWWQWANQVLGSTPPWRAVLVVAVLAGSAGAVTGGPVAAIAAAAYGGLAIHRVVRRRATLLGERLHRRQLDELCALAADLRAGLPPSVAMLPVNAPGRPAELTRAAVRLAERTGAPLADLVERIEADARAMDRGLASAEAQAAGARATAWLLAGLPLGGIALGYGIGVDPVRILLHTPIGAACAISAIVLQLTGLAWANRLSADPARVA